MTFQLEHGDCREILKKISRPIDMVFADPPYFLSNDGVSISSGRIVSVNKGEWDRSRGPVEDSKFTGEWLSLCRDRLKPDGTIWVSGTYHNIFTVAEVLSELNFKILNLVVWQKTDPPLNVSRKYFNYSAEYLVWARREKRASHYFNYRLMTALNDECQMPDVWTLPAVQPWEKMQGRHPTQKPLALLSRIVLASTRKGAWILDPFCGSGTTGIAANLLGRNFVGIDQDQRYLQIARARHAALDDQFVEREWMEEIPDVKMMFARGLNQLDV